MESLTPHSPAFHRRCGIDSYMAYDDQDVLHAEPITRSEFINTTVGRVIFNDHLPKDSTTMQPLMTVRPAPQEGPGALVNYVHLRFGLEIRADAGRS